ncbi:Protein of unknown function [Propionibacterium freudenreichii]|nr:Protein of unknown function [Propionibacterium freudenreichii]CEG89896.1 Protein of unknown function [Propionibacterium freudenreichii]CEG92310.1 Protein of unknown function [Propionibacterium freudenreichii]CEG95020.1 Protein of unknown function [Propionibacterium freudenreichii]CEH00082.1 Protein of unknown function [Propionibacterium freudenreichii]
MGARNSASFSDGVR